MSVRKIMQLLLDEPRNELPKILNDTDKLSLSRITKFKEKFAAKRYQQDFEIFTDDANQYFLELFGKYIPEKTKDRNNNIGARTIVVDTNKDFIQLCEELMEQKEEAKEDLFQFATIISDKQGGKVIIINMGAHVESLFNIYALAQLRPDDGFLNHLMGLVKTQNSDELKSILVDTNLHGNIAHELSHLYEDSDILDNKCLTDKRYDAFQECAARYYQYQIVFQKLNIQAQEAYFALFPTEGKRYVFFFDLVSKYKDDIHKMFFGQPVEEGVKKDILSWFTSDKIEELFPSGKSLNY